jgi:DNA-nicking Smr family endonuclease
MKKHKPPDQSPAEYKNNPFKALKGLTPSTALPAKKTTAAPVRETIPPWRDEDDASLFLREVEDVERVASAPDARDGQAAKPARERKGVRASEEGRLFLSAMQKIDLTGHDASPEHESADTGQRSPTSRMRQLKRGTIRISRELDLHGFLKDEALKRLEQFLADAFTSGQQAVLIITGKGINSSEGPVLQRAVAAWLRNKGKGIVAEFSPAPREHGGSGAFVVFLKK